jgi:hypothetical protein
MTDFFRFLDFKATLLIEKRERKPKFTFSLFKKHLKYKNPRWLSGIYEKTKTMNKHSQKPFYWKIISNSSYLPVYRQILLSSLSSGTNMQVKTT